MSNVDLVGRVSVRSATPCVQCIMHVAFQLLGHVPLIRSTRFYKFKLAYRKSLPNL